MSLVDPECFLRFHGSEQPVCARCFEDDDLRKVIKAHGGPRGCDYCGRKDAATIPLGEIAAYIQERMGKFYGKAVDQLPYESREGGYQGWHTDTYDLLFETIGLDLPRDGDNRLREDLVGELEDDVWCEYDWLVLEPDDSLRSSWGRFCSVVKHSRRFFFHNIDSGKDRDPDTRSPLEFLSEVCGLVERQRLIRTERKGYKLFRARPRKARERHTTAAALGPPPPEYALQSNRMNPPGIPMFYGAENAALATAETREKLVSVGTFETKRPIRLLDLADLPPVPGFFSETHRMDRLTMGFLHQFARIIVQPVPRNDRVHVDYIPTQVFTEFLRDYPFRGGRIDGLRYRSATGKKGANVVLFAGPKEVEGATGDDEFGTPPKTWLRLASVRHKSLSP
ncbi:RES domain-containing protein [Siccirubricoccus sp. KC 17139]|uniref:RES domain-containing protein n=1 Tax=Siccirubricoccus soli TaxID=2899147 RepID=A0ABT1D458_9PROT|nr:HEPN-associated N-terminal domain-containing protein [Siccirubricoccus soli]MCO6416065.1 RES domain-containing protein [Siccirubricoccus soli]MCP2682197.1 HEPN-associated N-terminal domain-containing protein [Siccirubricoccus soli]